MKIIDRLRAQAKRHEDGNWDRNPCAAMLREIADELEADEKELQGKLDHCENCATSWADKALSEGERADTAERKANENLIAYNRLQEDHGPGLGVRVRELEAHIKRLEGVAIMDGCRSAG